MADRRVLEMVRSMEAARGRVAVGCPFWVKWADRLVVAEQQLARTLQRSSAPLGDDVCAIARAFCARVLGSEPEHGRERPRETASPEPPKRPLEEEQRANAPPPPKRVCWRGEEGRESLEAALNRLKSVSPNANHDAMKVRSPTTADILAKSTSSTTTCALECAVCGIGWRGRLGTLATRAPVACLCHADRAEQVESSMFSCPMDPRVELANFGLALGKFRPQLQLHMSLEEYRKTPGRSVPLKCNRCHSVVTRTLNRKSLLGEVGCGCVKPRPRICAV
jgi:hypothetical protein